MAFGVGIVGARLAVEQGDLAEPVRRFHQISSASLPFSLTALIRIAPSTTQYSPQGASPRANRRWPGGNWRGWASASRCVCKASGKPWNQRPAWSCER